MRKKIFLVFFPRSLSRFFYTIFVGVIIGIIVDFITVEEKKVKRLFKREKRNTLQIRYEISQITTDIKRNYLILMIICLIIFMLLNIKIIYLLLQLTKCVFSQHHRILSITLMKF